MGLADLFWKNPNGEEKKVEKTSPKNQPASSPAPSTIGGTDAFQAPSINSGGVHGVKKQEIVDYFMKVFSENNIPGPDYQEFRTALDGMKTQPLDEGSKIKMLGISFKAMGLTPEKLVETANQYKKLFASRLDGYKAELAKQYDIQVGSKQKQVESFELTNKQIDDEMRKLNEKKIANEEAIKALGQEIQKNSAELATNKNDWQATYDDLVKEIDGHIELFNKHLIGQ